MYVAIGLELKHISYARQFRRRVPIFFCNFPAEAEAEKAVPRAVVDVFGHLSLLPLFAKVNDLEGQTFPSLLAVQQQFRACSLALWFVFNPLYFIFHISWICANC